MQDHEPERTTTHGDIVIFYDKPIPLGRYVEGGAIKPDIVVWDRKEKTAQIIEVTVPNDYGLNRAEREKNNKYQDLKNDLRTTWGLRNIELIPVVVGATGLVKKQPQGSSKFYALTQNFDSLCLLKLEEFSSILKNPGYLFSGEKNGEKKPAVK